MVLRADRAEPAPFDAHGAALLIREAAARALMTVVRPLGWGQAKPSADTRSSQFSRTPVLLVPGIRRNRSSLMFLRQFLKHRGWRWAHAVNHPRSDLGLAGLAAALHEQVEALREASGADQIDIVSHSYGGLVAAWYVKHMDGDKRVRRLVTVGSPLHGTKMAVFGRGRPSTELLPTAPILDELSPLPIRTICIWSPDDPVVVPSRSAIATDAESVRIEASGHVDMLVSGRVFRAVQTALSDVSEPA
ncbi:MAG: alpha/beta fold hydrolase [Proteobacteria bacterium]|nr:alpha/beta fold hydrolase [Pseudomonadota bacterium]